MNILAPMKVRRNSALRDIANVVLAQLIFVQSEFSRITGEVELACIAQKLHRLTNDSHMILLYIKDGLHVFRI